MLGKLDENFFAQVEVMRVKVAKDPFSFFGKVIVILQSKKMLEQAFIYAIPSHSLNLLLNHARLVWFLIVLRKYYLLQTKNLKSRSCFSQGTLTSIPTRKDLK